MDGNLPAPQQRIYPEHVHYCRHCKETEQCNAMFCQSQREKTCWTCRCRGKPE